MEISFASFMGHVEFCYEVMEITTDYTYYIEGALEVYEAMPTLEHACLYIDKHIDASKKGIN